MPLQFSFEQKVLFKHCDPAGIAFFPRYFEMINDCVEQFFDEALGWPFEELLQNEGVPTAEISTRFLAPSRHGDRLRLLLTVTRVGRSALGYRIDATCNGAHRFEAEATLVHVDKSGTPTAWPEAIRAKLKENGS
ncbi:acyl-CoA thioesterase [Ovoidimarina sediminis]|uniref:acyl-CoA thioesterase n=1 Tax=Ovoidimarina sediminis TaxID=3079856 RepID=UPI00290706C8|nr:thioesterase family protein [Rhodophyticola sp. MJ-SS7]MDU8944121.1 thioesterase family protein [Rhodophyticola sp. MJ-SS7]